MENQTIQFHRFANLWRKNHKFAGMTLLGADTRRFLSKLSLTKIWNLCKILVSYYISKWRKKAVIWGKPMTISIEPTTACNLRCPECPSGLRNFNRPTGNLKEDFFRKILDEIGHQLTYLIFYFQGEPYINPKFLDMVAYASKRGIYTITSTNGHFMSEANARKTIDSGLDRIIISIDGTTQEVYEAYRKEGKLANVIKGVENLVAAKKDMKASHPHIIIQFLVVGPNEHQIPDIYDLGKKLGVDEVKLKTAQIYDYQNGNYLIPKNEKYARYTKRKDGTYGLKYKLVNHCWKLWHAAVITWDGKVLSCCFDKDAKYEMGSLRKNSFHNIWHSKNYMAFRNQILVGRSQIDICQNCTEGCKVWLQAEV